VDLGKVFEKGQAYVALSRATSQQGLQVLRFEKQKVMAHPRVIQFYDKLYSAEAAIKKKKATPAPSLSTFIQRAAVVPEPPVQGPSKPSRTESQTSIARRQIEVIDLDFEAEEEAMAAYGY